MKTPSPRTLLGLALTAGYLGIAAWLRFPFRLETLRTMPLNELGDAFAGFVGPVALLWLVLGYFQQGEELRLQGEELRQNGEALRLQADELKNAVEQHKEMVKATRDSVDFQKETWMRETEEERRRLMPRFEVVDLVKNGSAVNKMFWKGTFRLKGSVVHNVRMAHSGNRVFEFTEPRHPTVHPETLVQFEFGCTISPGAEGFPRSFHINLKFEDAGKQVWVQEFEWHADQNDPRNPVYAKGTAPRLL